jgi:dUTP pyrophosphatase
MTVEVRVQRLAHAEGLPLPSYESAGAAGADLCSAEAATVAIAPGQRVALATGLVIEIPDGYEAQVRPRSGLAARHGLTVVNAPGTIDSDYRGEVKVLLVNLGQETATVDRGDRIAQLVVAPVTRVEFVESEHVNDTDRGAGGFGSTGR